jgi:hypothetical protein
MIIVKPDPLKYWGFLKNRSFQGFPIELAAFPKTSIKKNLEIRMFTRLKA